MAPHTAYDDYLASPHWRRTRARYARARCTVCDTPRSEVHHRTYARVGHERPQDLVPLCRRHHSALHRFARVRPHLTLSEATERYLGWVCPLERAAA